MGEEGLKCHAQAAKTKRKPYNLCERGGGEGCVSRGGERESKDTAEWEVW